MKKVKVRISEQGTERTCPEIYLVVGNLILFDARITYEEWYNLKQAGIKEIYSPSIAMRVEK